LPDFPVVDTHVPLYDPRRLSYPWMKREPALDCPSLADDFVRLTAGVDIEAMVFVGVDTVRGDHLKEALRAGTGGGRTAALRNDCINAV
jgi:predicted TIM-barrel fold metal-dependent hydrolase